MCEYGVDLRCRGSLPPPRLHSLRDVEDELEDEREQLHEALFKPLKRWRETGEPPADYVEERPEWLHDSGKWELVMFRTSR